MRKTAVGCGALYACLLSAAPAWADAGRVDSGDTAWMLVSTVLVLLMTLPGLALFYAGMVRKKNVLATMMQSLAACALASVAWAVAGYSLAFGDGGAWIGDLSRLMLAGLGEGWDRPFVLGAATANPVPTTIPESVYLMFQMTFAIIAPALIYGAVAERMRFSALVLFTMLWSLLVYAPVAHWVWAPNGWIGGGVFGLPGAADFAGGTVVHVNAGVAALVCALVLGRRRGLGQEHMAPWNLAYAVIGASLLWVGWFGFNAGSALAAGGRAGMAMLATQLAAAAAALAWCAAEWALKGTPSVLGAVSGAVAGLVAITPAAGFVLPGAALLIGFVAGGACLWSATALKRSLGYDDSLDAFGVHGVGGMLGALMTGVLAHGPLSATAAAPLGLYVAGMTQLASQALAVGATVAWSAAATFAILKGVSLLLPLRADEEEEREGLDLSLHGERVE